VAVRRTSPAVALDSNARGASPGKNRKRLSRAASPPSAGVSGGARRLDTTTAPIISPRSVEYLRQRLAKPPDGRHDPRVIFGSGLTMERIQSTIYSADWGNPRALTDLSRETLSLDPHLSAVLTKRIGAVASLPVDVLPAEGPGIDPEKAQFYAEVVRAQIQRIPNLKQAIRQLAWGLFDGRAVLEKQWAKAPGKPHPKFGQVRMVVTMLSWIHPRRVFFGPDRELRVIDRPIGIGFTRDGMAFRDQPHKFIEFTPQLFAEYPEREGLARPCLYWAFFKRFGARERMILLELFAKPWRWGEIPDDSDLSPQEVADLDTIVEQIAGNGYGRLPRGTKLNIAQQGQTSASGTIHKEVIDQSDAQISKLVLGQTGTTDAKSSGSLGGGNSASQTSVMKDEQDQICLSDASMIEEVLEDYLSDDIIEVNFGPFAVTHAPRIKLHADTVDRAREIANLDSTLKTGLAVALDEAYERTGYRKPADDEAVLRLQSPASGGTAPDGSPLPPGAPVPVVAYPRGQVPTAQRALEPPAAVEGAPVVVEPEGETPDEGPVPALPGPTGEDSPVVRAPDGDDPNQTGNASGDDLESPNHEGASGLETNPGVATPEDGSVAELGIEGNQGVTSYEDAEESDNVPRGVLTRSIAAGKRIRLIGDVIQKQEYGGTTPTPEKGRSAAPPDVQPVSMVPADEELTLPMGPYSDFADCVADQKKKGHSDESAKKICGSIKKKIEGAVDTATIASGGAVNATGARRLIHVLGEGRAMLVIAAMRARTLAKEPKVSGKQPSSVYGSPEPLVSKAVRELAPITKAWGEKFASAAEGAETPAQVYAAVYGQYHKLDVDEFSRALRRRILHAEMLGLLDHHYEKTTDETVAPATFMRSWLGEIVMLAGADAVAKVKPTFSDLSPKSAAQFFQKKQVLPKAEFEKLEAGAKSRAFTVARMESQEMLELVHAELGRMISEGYDPKAFSKFMRERVESAGWTPANASHVQTIARTNLVQAHTAGKLVDMTNPATLVDRPYWQNRGVKDSRQRATHGAIDGWVLRADDPFWQQCVPPYGFNCRDKLTTLSERQVKKRGIEVRSGSEISDLPDEGFTGHGAGALLSAFGMG
jgi:SPP1 gp7 family putative phage head morphogenesis protein